MNAEFYKCQLIKNLIEQAAKVEDIGARSRQRPFPELKKIYAKLCKQFTKASLTTIGKELGGFDHASTYNQAKTFDDLRETDGLDLLHVYESVFSKLDNDKDFLNNQINNQAVTIYQIEKKYRVKLIKIIDKNHSIINKKNARIKELEQQLHDKFLKVIKQGQLFHN